ncbi:MAG: CoA-binding protein [Methanobacteriota archaeon]|jgi:predicted CoA-binding protein|nr:MAG: CoA-binding protein [Euryarchaeota archaeon]
MIFEKLKTENVRIALIGASNDKQKFGNQIYLDLRSKGYDILPINPKEKIIEGDKAYAELNKMDDMPDIVNFVVPPNIAMKVAKEAVELGIEYLWFQPGSESPELENWLKNTNGIKYLINSCIMVDTL